MIVKSVLNGASMNLRSLKNRLQVQMGATHDPSDKADLKEWIEDTDLQIKALDALCESYASIVQSAIDLGMAGKRHRIAVQSRNPDYSGDYDDPVAWDDVSTHEFTVA